MGFAQKSDVSWTSLEHTYTKKRYPLCTSIIVRSHSQSPNSSNRRVRRRVGCRSLCGVPSFQTCTLSIVAALSNTPQWRLGWPEAGSWLSDIPVILLGRLQSADASLYLTGLETPRAYVPSWLFATTDLVVTLGHVTDAGLAGLLHALPDKRISLFITGEQRRHLGLIIHLLPRGRCRLRVIVSRPPAQH